ncbi:MAG: hypothetical protein ACI915_004693 [Gammaproteobacteria bacterium]|jgi:hypothetical protein
MLTPINFLCGMLSARFEQKKISLSISIQQCAKGRSIVSPAANQVCGIEINYAEDAEQI